MKSIDMRASRISLIIQLIAAVFVLVFLYTAIEKFRQPGTFISTMEQSSLLRPYRSILVWLIPCVELLAVLLLVVPASRLWGLRLCIGLMGGFSAYIAYMLAFESTLPCSCGGVLQYMSWKMHLLFNLALLLLGIAGILLSKKYKRIIAISQEPRRTPV